VTVTHNLPYSHEHKHAGGVWDTYGYLWKQMCDQWNNGEMIFAEHASMWGTRWHNTLFRLREHLNGEKQGISL